MKGLAKWLLTGFIAMAIYGAFSKVLITGTNSTDTLMKASMPIAIGVACLVGIIMLVAAFSSKFKR